MNKSNPVITQVPIRNSDLTLRHDAEGIRVEALEAFLPLVQYVIQDPQRSEEIASDLAEMARVRYEERTHPQLRAFQEAMKTEAFDQIFSEWSKTLKPIVTPKSFKALQKEIKKMRTRVINDRYKHVWDVRPHRPLRAALERALTAEADQRKLTETVRKVVRKTGYHVRDVTPTDIAREMFPDVNCLEDKRSALSRFFNRPGVDFNKALEVVNAEEEQKQIYVQGQRPQLTGKG